jgi:dienelactone hydrolase
MDRRHSPRWAALATAAILLTGCSGGSASGGPGGTGTDIGPTGLREVRDIPYAKALTEDAEDLALDVYAPTGAGPFPMVVYSPGGEQEKDSGITIARKLAEKGMVVLVADHWHGTGPDDPPLGIAERSILEQTACALRMARELAPAYGGDPGGVTWTGYSLGGIIGFEIALADADVEQQWDAFVAEHGGPGPVHECVSDEAPVPVAALVVTGSVRAVDVWPDTYAADPALGDLVGETVRIGNNPDLVVRMIHGTADAEVPYALAENLATLLQKAGYDAELTTVKGGDHAPNADLMVSTVMALPDR